MRMSLSKLVAAKFQKIKRHPIVEQAQFISVTLGIVVPAVGFLSYFISEKLKPLQQAIGAVEKRIDSMDKSNHEEMKAMEQRHYRDTKVMRKCHRDEMKVIEHKYEQQSENMNKVLEKVLQSNERIAKLESK